MNTIGIILAAGSSMRMSHAKQLLQYNGQSLIRHIAEISTQLPLIATYCVTGPITENIYAELSDMTISYIDNPYHTEGMGRSLSVALSYILKHHDPDAIIVMLTDQPLIPLSHYLQLLSSAERYNDKLIFTSRYKDTFGAPSLFSKSVFSSILTLDANSGAKSIIKNNIDKTHFIDCDAAGFDIDTDEDYEMLLGR